MNTLAAKKLKGGPACTIFALEIDGVCEVWQFLRELQPEDHKKCLTLLEFTAKNGTPKNEEKYKDIEGSDGLFEFKPTKKVRLICFPIERDLLIVLGVIKEGKIRKQDLERAHRLQDAYLNQAKEAKET